MDMKTRILNKPEDDETNLKSCLYCIFIYAPPPPPYYTRCIHVLCSCNLKLMIFNTLLVPSLDQCCESFAQMYHTCI